MTSPDLSIDLSEKTTEGLSLDHLAAFRMQFAASPYGV